MSDGHCAYGAGSVHRLRANIAEQVADGVLNNFHVGDGAIVIQAEPQRHLAATILGKSLAVEQVIPALRDCCDEAAVVITKGVAFASSDGTSACRRVPPSCCNCMLGIEAVRWASASLSVRGRSGFSSFFCGVVSNFASFVSPTCSVGLGCAAVLLSWAAEPVAAAAAWRWVLWARPWSWVRPFACHPVSAGSNPCSPQDSPPWNFWRNNIWYPWAVPASPDPDPRPDRCWARMVERAAADFFSAPAALVATSATSARGRFFYRVRSRPTPADGRSVKTPIPTATVGFKTVEAHGIHFFVADSHVEQCCRRNTNRATVFAIPPQHAHPSDALRIEKIRAPSANQCTNELTLLLRQNQIDCQSRKTLYEHKIFSELGLSPEILKAIEKLGFEKAAPIQAEAIRFS